MSPENVTRAAEKKAAEQLAYAQIDAEESVPIDCLSEEDFNEFLASRTGFYAGASWRREQHREVLIRLKHILERGLAAFGLADDDILEERMEEALAVIQKELAP